MTQGNLVAGSVYDYRVSVITQIGTGAPSSVTTGAFVDATLTMTANPIGGNTVEIIPSISLNSAQPPVTVSKLWVYNADPQYNEPITKYSYSNTINEFSSYQFPTVYEYPVTPQTYWVRAWVTQDSSTSMFTSNSVSVTPLQPYSNNIMGLEQRNNATAGSALPYTQSEFTFMAQPANYDLVLKYQHIDPTIEPKFYVYENVQTTVNATVGQLDSQKDYYISAYLNPTEFDYDVIDPATNEIQIKCNDDSPETCGEPDSVVDDIPKGIASEFVIRSHKNPDAQTQLGIEPMGDLFGLPMVFIFIIGLGAVFTGKNAQMGIIFIAVTLGVMGYLGYLDFDNPATTDLDENIIMWGLIVLIAILGVFVGKRWT